MQHLVRLLLVLGFCVGSLGAAGFDLPRRAYALPLFVTGLVLLGVGGWLARAQREKERALATQGDGLGRHRARLAAVRDEVVALEQSARASTPDEVRERIEALSNGALFDLTAGHEELLLLLGPGGYARVWEGVATAERLLNRAWSLITDDAAGEALDELPLARVQIERAVSALGPAR